MDTQTTPIHIRLWNRDFWLLATANLLLTMAAYSQIVNYPMWMLMEGMTWTDVAFAMGAYGVGIFLLGAFCSYLLQKYRRNHVCELAIWAMAACMAVPFLTRDFMTVEPWMAILSRLLAGASFGLAQMTLTSTLIVDCSEASQRTEANYAAAWFARLAVSLGPLVACVILMVADIRTAQWVAVALAVVSIGLIGLVRFPFRAPDDQVNVVSLDRFFLPEGWLLFLHLIGVTVVIGVLLGFALQFTTMAQLTFFAMLMVGFLIALLAEKYVFVNAELLSEIVVGLLLMGGAVVVTMSGNISLVRFLSPVLIGMGAGLVGSRFLLSFIKLSRHCQRGTSQSTFFLAWEAGIGVGIGLGTGLSWHEHINILYCSLAVIGIVLLLYVLYTHSWYMKHKNR